MFPGNGRQAPPESGCWEQAVPVGGGICPWAEAPAALLTRPAIPAGAAFPHSTSQLSTLELIREPSAPFSHIIKACLKPGDKREH